MKLIKMVLAGFFLSLLACTPIAKPSAEKSGIGKILSRHFITPDQLALPLQQWPTITTKPRAVLIALHGFNDYSRFFAETGTYLKQQQIISYAYDMRGFGGAANRGSWAGVKAYIADLKLFIELVKQKHPHTPIYLLGESMGAALAILVSAEKMPLIDGVILCAPAVWSRATMPWYQRLVLEALFYTVPWVTVTGEDLDVLASDNISMLRALGADPLLIKNTRIEAIHGLVDLMDQAMANAAQIKVNTLLLYGEKDEIIPHEPTEQFLQALLSEHPANKLIACYENGYHLLLRDLQAPLLWQDIAGWILTDKTSLPSNADKYSHCQIR